MKIHEAALTHQVVEFEAADPLATTHQLLHYLTAGITESRDETFIVGCLNPKRRPICRLQLKHGVFVASRLSVSDVLLPVLLAEAKAFACLRTQPTGEAQLRLADGRLLYHLRESAGHLGLELADYLVARLESGDFYSWRQHDPRRV